MSVTKIVLTGGPCAGKSTALSRLQQYFSEKNYCILTVPESATELISGGINTEICGDNKRFQEYLIRLQLAKEEIYDRAAAEADARDDRNVLIVCDRGVMDDRAYMTDDEFNAVLNALGTNEIALRDRYDAVFHMVTAAKGAGDFYTTANNTARSETPEEACTIDDKLIASWTGHPHLRVIDNSTDFESKIRRLITEICALLGVPEPLEIERKFLIRYPDLRLLQEKPNCRRVEIIQTYLNPGPDGEEIRVRQRGADGNFIYFKTIKKTVVGMKRIEIEDRITEKEYLSLLLEADTARHPIRKTRYCLTENNRYFEIDVYPFWQHQAVMEIELADEGEQVIYPQEITVMREVTGDKAYGNSSLALNIPKEDRL